MDNDGRTTLIFYNRKRGNVGFSQKKPRVQRTSGRVYKLLIVLLECRE